MACKSDMTMCQQDYQALHVHAHVEKTDWLKPLTKQKCKVEKYSQLYNGGTLWIS